MKAYVKPDLYYEEFVLAAHIAACSFQTQQGIDYTCVATNEEFGYQIFDESISCEMDSGVYDGFCLTNGGDGFNTFGS